MARRIRWQILITFVCGAMILFLLGHLALATTSEGAPETGGMYREALIGPIRDLNPLRGSQQTLPEADITALIFEGLTRVETSGVVVPDLATSWDVAQDQRVYTLTLRTDVLWQDDTPFTSDDVIWTINSIQSSTFSGDPNLQIAWQNVRVTPIDSYTVRFDLPAAFAPFLNQLSLPMTPAHILQDANELTRAKWGEAPIGTGSYQLFERNETEITLQRFSNYRRGDNRTDPGLQPNLEQINFLLFSDLNEAHSALRRGTVDGLAYNITEQDPLPFIPDVIKVQAPLADYVLLSFNLRRKPLDTLAVRRGLAYSIDPQSIIDSGLEGHALPLLTPILPSSWAFNPQLVPYSDDVEHTRAIATFKEAGWQRNATGQMAQANQPMQFNILTANSGERIKVAESIASQLETLGISTTIEPVTTEELNQRILTGDFDLAIHGWSNLGSDPDIYELWHSSQITAANISGLENEKIDRVLTQARQISDIQTRTELYQEFQAEWLAQSPAIMLYQPLLEQQVAPDFQILGLEEDASLSEILYRPADRFRRIANWYQSTARQIRSDLRSEPVPQRPR